MSSSNKSPKRMYLTRHAQAEHNVSSDWSIQDAKLTDFGRSQTDVLNQTTRDIVQKRAQLIACSPLRRTMETMLRGFPEALKRLEADGKPPILLDILQEAGDLPCDTALWPIEELKNSQDGLFAHLDFSNLSPDYASKKGIFSHARAADRAREVRKWLRARPEQEIIVVAHGDILRYIMDGKNSSRQWDNTQIRVVTFASESDSDAEAVLIEVAEVEPEKATSEPTSSDL